MRLFPSTLHKGGSNVHGGSQASLLSGKDLSKKRQRVLKGCPEIILRLSVSSFRIGCLSWKGFYLTCPESSPTLAGRKWKPKLERRGGPEMGSIWRNSTGGQEKGLHGGESVGYRPCLIHRHSLPCTEQLDYGFCNIPGKSPLSSPDFISPALADLEHFRTQQARLTCWTHAAGRHFCPHSPPFQKAG